MSLCAVSTIIALPVHLVSFALLTSLLLSHPGREAS